MATAPASGVLERPRDTFWTTRRNLAAEMMAAGETWAKIEAATERSHGWLLKTNANPKFQHRVAEIVEAHRQVLLTSGIAVKALRMSAKDERWRLLQQVRKARAEAMPDDAPGTDTGLMVHQVKSLGAGRDATIIDEYVIDAGALAAELALEESAAREMGDIPKTPQSGPRGRAALELENGAGERIVFSIEMGTPPGGEE